MDRTLLAKQLVQPTSPGTTTAADPRGAPRPCRSRGAGAYFFASATAKRLGGHYSSFRGNGAVPGFQFKTRENADAFLAFIGGNAAAAKEVVQDRRDSFADDKSQSAVERLNEMADRLDEKANESLGRERKANTERRARFAARQNPPRTPKRHWQ